MPNQIDALLDIVARLRDPNHGCPWDLAQTHISLAPFVIEEAYEVVDAIEQGDSNDLRDELGDLLFQVVLHARLAQERREFAFEDVVEAVCKKMERRHPHVFGAIDVGASAPSWEQLKNQERAEQETGDMSALSGISAGIPELAKAIKLQKKASMVGFDWNNPLLVIEKVKEELDEVLAELQAETGTADHPDTAIAEEVGDLLFACVNLARHLSLDPGQALRRANSKFEQRFRKMEQIADARGLQFGELSLVQQEGLWQEAKRQLATDHASGG